MVLSYNTFGATAWTDAKVVAPMMPDFVHFTECRHCQAFYWPERAEQVGEVERWCRRPAKINAEWAGALPVVEPDEEGYYRALAASSAGAWPPSDEKLVRLLAWWRHNDPQRGLGRPVSREPRRLGRWLDWLLGVAPARQTTPRPLPAPDAWRVNLLALLELLDPGVQAELLLSVECCRELGRFEEALALLATAAPGPEDYRVAQLTELCRQQDARLWRVQPPPQAGRPHVPRHRRSGQTPHKGDAR